MHIAQRAKRQEAPAGELLTRRPNCAVRRIHQSEVRKIAAVIAGIIALSVKPGCDEDRDRLMPHACDIPEKRFASLAMTVLAE